MTQHETHSGNSSGSESATEALSSRSTRASRAKRSLEMPSIATNSYGGSSSNNTTSARSKRRKAVDDDLLNMFNPTVLEDLLNAMMRHRDGWPFDRPITKAEAPDYHKIIKRPMDLGTIRSSINRMKYTCNQQVMEDIEQVFVNCRIYNKEDAEEYQCGARLEKYFRKEAKKLNLLVDEEDSDKPAKKARRTL